MHQDLNDRQREAVETIDGALLILAGAGSGKTRVITYRIAHMLRQGIPQSQILALTFTNKAAREMVERVKQIVGHRPRDLTLSTFHSFGAHFLRDHIKLLGYRKAFSIYDSSDRQTLIRDVAVEMGMDRRSLDLTRLEATISAIKMNRAPADDTDCADLFETYQAHLKSHNAVDFDDLIALPLSLMLHNEQARSAINNRYRFTLVDEFQDTSAMQYQLLRTIAQPSGNVCVVGDDDQSIYSWRGASYENLSSFEKDFPGSRSITLDQNYRSTGVILEAANHLISNNSNRKDKALWTASGSGESIGLFIADDEVQESEFIARTIQSLKQKNRTRYGDFGVLIRANSLTRPLEEAFRHARLPYRVSGGLSFYQRREVRDVIAYLKVLANPDDDISFVRILNTPRRGIGRKTLDALSAIANRLSCSLYSAACATVTAADSPLPAKARLAVEELVELLQRYGEIVGTGRRMADGVAALVDDINYWGHLVSEVSRPEIARWRYDNVESLIDGLRRYASDPDRIDPTLVDYLGWVAVLSTDEDDDDRDRDRINLMTVHAAKGLEFDTVFVAAVEQGLFPHARTMQDGDHNLEEERRLFYVAVTRARRRLFLSAARARTRRGQPVEAGPSSFVQELPERLLEILSSEEEPLTKDEAEDGFAQIKARFQ